MRIGEQRMPLRLIAAHPKHIGKRETLEAGDLVE